MCPYKLHRNCMQKWIYKFTDIYIYIYDILLISVHLYLPTITPPLSKKYVDFNKESVN